MTDLLYIYTEKEKELVFTSTRAVSRKANDYITGIYIFASIAIVLEHHWYVSRVLTFTVWARISPN